MMLALHPPGDYVSDQIRRTGTWYEAEILDYVAPLVPRGVIVDAGAMIGNHSVYFARHVEHEAIHAFEPWPDNLDLLRRNVVDYPTVTVHAKALSNVHRTLRMVSEANRGHSRVDASGPVVVQAVPLDAYELENVVLLKIDVEGHEPQVLTGARDTIARCRPFILIEDWTGRYHELLPDYALVEEWATRHQTYLYAPAKR